MFSFLCEDTVAVRFVEEMKDRGEAYETEKDVVECDRCKGGDKGGCCTRRLC